MHLCLTVERDEHIVSTNGGDQGDLSEDPTIVNQHDEYDHEEQHDKHNVQNEPFLESWSKAQAEVVVIGHPVQSNTETFSRALELPVKDFWERIMHFKTDLMLLKQRVSTVRDTVLQENIKIEEIIGKCANSSTKLFSVEERLKSLIRQQEE